ncbi:MAG: hypothetical protein RI575_03070 [Balneolaceae bacterium]|nr:hypothetical protein [Balneolaceae bacterium]
MKHQFFQKSDSEQQKFLWKTGLLLFLVSSLILLICYLTGLYHLAGLIPIAILITAPFIDLPIGRKNGKFIYYSPLFITEPERNGKVVVHGGTLFDYLFTITSDLKGRNRTRFVLYGYILGLLRFISEHENKSRGDLQIRGTSYIINDKTAARFGLKPVKTDILQLLILLLNYIPITLSYSYIKQKVHFPKISEIKTYEGKLSEMVRHKEKLIELKNQLEPT